MSKPLGKWTRKEFETLPARQWAEDIGRFDSMVILPTRHIHDSGYRCMDFVAVRKDKPVCRLSGCSDVIHFDGIGGYGKRGLSQSLQMKARGGWNMDCLKTSGLLQIWCDSGMSCGSALSSFEIYRETKND